jgi:hypothetical protein
MVSFMPQPLYAQGKSFWYPWNKKLSGPQNWSGYSGEEKNSQAVINKELTKESKKTSWQCHNKI